MTLPGAAFGEAPLAPRPLDPGMGLAIARRTVFRPADRDDFGRVADRVAAGSLSLLGKETPEEATERARLRNAIAAGALLTSGRHLQHGEPGQGARGLEVFTNCATAIASFAVFYLLLSGAGVGRSYDDELIAVDWADAPRLLLHLSAAHPDYPHGDDALLQLGRDLGLPAEGGPEAARAFLARELLPDLAAVPEGALLHRVADSREGWAKAVEILEAMAFRRERDRVLVLDLSDIRPAGRPIEGMQGRPASGPLSLLRGLLAIRRNVIEPARSGAAGTPAPDAPAPWEQALRIDHLLSIEVQAGGARRSARMATKSWRDPGVLRFIRAKEAGGLWTANNSVMVDREFWRLLDAPEDTDEDTGMARHARAVFAEATRCAWRNGEPGLINGDLLEDHRNGSAWRKPVFADGRDLRSARYQVDAASGLIATLSRRAARAAFPVITNPCGEIALHATGGYCVIADFAPLLACPVPLDTVAPGAPSPAVAALWDARVEDSVRLGVRFLIRANRMDALYAQEVARTNRIGIGPTGLHEWAWMRFGLSFRDLLDEARAAPFWAMLDRLSAAAKAEADAYAAALGMAPPATVTTIKPAGTTSKLFGLTEGAHLPSRRHYLRWVQFRGTRDATGAWRPGADRLLAEYEAQGYPVRELRGFPGMSAVGFPTEKLILRLGLGAHLVTATEATPGEHYRWLRLLERHWIGASRGNQVSYTLKADADAVDLDAFRRIVRREQPQVRCCAILPERRDDRMGYEYLPEEDIPEDAFAALAARIGRAEDEAVDVAQLACASGACPI